MIIYRARNVVITDIPFSGGTGSKIRPAVVLFDVGDDDVVIMPTTTSGVRGPFDVEIVEWAKSGFLAPCWVRVNKMQTITKSLIKKHPGSLETSDWVNVRAAINRLFGTIPP